MIDVFRIDVHKLRETQSDAEFRKLLYDQMQELHNCDIETLCYKFRNDYILMNPIAKENLQSECKRWLEAFFNNR